MGMRAARNAILRGAMHASILYLGRRAAPGVLEGYRRALATDLQPGCRVDTHVTNNVEEAVELLERECCCLLHVNNATKLQAANAANPRALARSLLADLRQHVVYTEVGAHEAFLREHGLGGGVECNSTLLDEERWSPRHKAGRMFLRVDTVSRIAEFEAAKMFLATLYLNDVNGYTIVPFRPGKGVLRWCFAAFATTEAPSNQGVAGSGVARSVGTGPR